MGAAPSTRGGQRSQREDDTFMAAPEAGPSVSQTVCRLCWGVVREVGRGSWPRTVFFGHPKMGHHHAVQAVELLAKG